MIRHGVALIKVGRSLGLVEEYYGVIFAGKLLAPEFKTFNEAARHLENLEDRAAA